MASNYWSVDIQYYVMPEIFYDRDAVYRYAREWAYKRNPAYLDFEKIGGDCTNFASQCLYAGCGVMNYKPVLGWYYISASNRTASWTGVQYLYSFLVSNKGVGAYAAHINKDDLIIGDLVQLGDASGRYYHTPVVVGNDGGEIFVAAHTFDTFFRPLSSYLYSNIRCLRIGARR